MHEDSNEDEDTREIVKNEKEVKVVTRDELRIQMDKLNMKLKKQQKENNFTLSNGAG